ncbi:SEFIR domain-containing protein [Amycolatopsis vancoresmycina]|uniref:SEFIR domain-containing protein n=1 Tax=Amycolatopsis vancoresmycina DSM 44592 TaxID=1292037 RepID=R1HMM7_9PSEU|nr:SEFIR domain-containing protein [Amycolatopsis vancoresmycina]EOD64805.1 SEFIR domain-containing protein [Amycolatopsis vancoresmycina DSM 44592]
MSEPDPPKVFFSYSHDTEEHKELVRRFATFLHSRIGLEVVLDQWHDNHRIDWSLWATRNLKAADFVIVVASPLYRARADGEAPPDEGRGAQFETAIIRNKLTRDLEDGTRRVLPVVLPGRSIDEIPEFLNPYSMTRYEIAEFSDEGVADLLAAITGQGRHPMPRRGVWRGGARAPRRVPAGDLPWTCTSPGVRRGEAWIDGLRYADSIVLRPRTPSATGQGFVELDLGGHYQRFTTVAGVLDNARDPFQVGRVRTVLDGTPRSEHDVSAGKPATIDLDVTGARVLRLELSRPGVAASPFGSAAVVVTRRGRPPELALGDPAVT